MLLQIDSEFLFLYFFSHKNEPQNQHKCLVLSVLIASRYAAHAHAAWKLKGTGYEHLQFFPKSVLPFKHLYNLATCYYHARVRLIFFVTRVQHPFPPKNYKLLGHPIVGSVRNIFLQ